MPAGNPPNVYFIMTLRSASSSLIHQVLPKVRTPEHKCLGASQYAAHLQAVPIIFSMIGAVHTQAYREAISGLQPPRKFGQAIRLPFRVEAAADNCRPYTT